MGNRARWSTRVAARVKEAVEASPLTVSKVVRLTGIPRTTFDRRLEGINPWDLEQLEAVAEAIDVDLDEFFPPANRKADKS